MVVADLLYDVIASELRARGLKTQREIAAFVKERVGWTLPQQAISKIANKQIEEPRQSTHVLALLFALGRDAVGKPIRETPVEEKALKHCVITAEKAIEAVGADITAEGRAELVAFLHKVFVTDGALPSQAVILEFVRRIK